MWSSFTLYNSEHCLVMNPLRTPGLIREASYIKGNAAICFSASFVFWMNFLICLSDQLLSKCAIMSVKLSTASAVQCTGKLTDIY